jgi:hypothetical protein
MYHIQTPIFIFTYTALSWASPLTYQIVGHIKQSFYIYMLLFIYNSTDIHIIIMFIHIFLIICTVLSWASPLTYQVIGHIKTIIILITGVFLYDDVPTAKSVLGMSLAMVGVIIYTEENRQQQLRRQKPDIIPEMKKYQDEKI